MAKNGKDTTEYAVTKSAGLWGVIMMVLGLVTVNGGALLERFGQADSKFVIIGGALIAIAGIVQKTLTSLGYTKSRTIVKASEAKATKPKP